MNHLTLNTQSDGTRSRGLCNAMMHQSCTSNSSVSGRDHNDCSSESGLDEAQGRAAAAGLAGVIGAAVMVVSNIVIQAAKR